MRLIPFFILLALGLAAGFVLAPFEAQAVQNHLLGFPNANARIHALRPYAVIALCLIPAAGALWYGFASTLDRYLFRRTLSAFLLTNFAFLLLFLLMDLQDSLGDLSAGVRNLENPARFVGTYYVVFFSQVTVLLLPFTILLALLYSLGQLSATREIIAFTQTGRGIGRLLKPLVVLGLLLSGFSFFLNFHLAPWAEGYREALLDSSKYGSASQATNVIYRNADERRLWFIGRFPYDLAGEAPLRDVTIITRDDSGALHDVFKTPEASWDRESGDWTFQKPNRLLAQTQPTPEYVPGMPEQILTSDWEETPSILIQEGLDARYQGIPGLQDWLRQNQNPEARLAPSFETQLQYRFAQPILCLVTVLLAAPLGISFSRRGRGGTAAVAVILSGLMLFSSEIFLAFGDSGRLPAIPAAWATNVIFFLVALILIERRFSGRPIFQTFRKCFGG